MFVNNRKKKQTTADIGEMSQIILKQIGRGERAIDVDSYQK